MRYDDVARTLVHALKYRDRTDLAPAMGRWMVRAGRELLDDANMLVPVPSHWRRGWSRRYNQSGALARIIERQSGVKVAAEAQRRVRHIVLIDDVLTSGATVDACARALLRAKAAAVDVLVFARVVDGPRTPI